MSLLLAAGEHGHLDLGVSVGSLALRVVLLAAVPVVAGFALLRGFLADPGRFTTVAVMGVATGAAAMELLLSGGLNLPDQVVPLLLAALALPMYLVLSHDERFAPAVGQARRAAPLIFTALAAYAAIQFGTAWWAGAGPDRTATVLHTGVLLGLVALTWFALSRPSNRAITAGTRVAAALLAMAVLAGAAQAVTMRPPEPLPGLATTAKVEVGPRFVDALLVPNLPGWNLVQVDSPTASIGTTPDSLKPAHPHPGTTGGWQAVELPAGRSDIWISDAGAQDSFTTDTGSAGVSPLTGPDAPECASVLLARMLTSATATGVQCPSESLSPRDVEALHTLVTELAAQGHRQFALAEDSSPRGKAAAAEVRAAATRRALTEVPPGEDVPLLLTTGWPQAAELLAKVATGTVQADGTYLAPWLFTEPLLAPDADQRIALPFTVTDELFHRYRTELRDDYPTQTPSAGGYQAWLAERRLPGIGRPQVLPIGKSEVDTLR